jgi:exonuclease SbcC
MRILAVRGANLASLAGDFEIRLDAPPLGDAGLFAITGRTGSGKSTLLDALCLALYDRMPRLLGGSGVEVGRADDAPEIRIKGNDVRSILRRGAGEGYAEVDFVGVEGGRWRARWSVRRARRRAAGRLQGQTLELCNLETDQSLSGTKTEVLERIEQRLGLTSDQFRRAVLLPQGDFAAFLRAAPKERAGLLERITGTEIYGRLSAAAYRRAAEEKQRLELMEQRLGDHRPLEGEDRLALDRQWVGAKQALERLRLEREGLQQLDRWYQALERLTAEHRQAMQQMQAADTAQQAAVPRRQAWERIRALQPLRLPLSAFDRARQALGEARRVLQSSREREQRLNAEARKAAEALAAARANAERAEQTRRDAVPALREARMIDTRLKGAREQLAQLLKDRDRAQKALSKAEAGLGELTLRRQEAEAALEQAEGWLQSHALLQPLAEHWDAWARDLERCAKARRERDLARGRIEQAERRSEGLGQRRQALSEQTKQIEADLHSAEKQWDSLKEQAARHDQARLAAERDDLLARRRVLEERCRILDRAGETRRRLEQQQASLHVEQGRHEQAGGRLQVLRGEIAPLQAACDEAEQAHRRLLLAAAGNVEALRRQLRDGEPCPVCGAEEHPWAHRAAQAMQGLAEEQAERVAALDAKLLEKTEERARKQAQAEQSRRRAAELEQEIAAAQTDLGFLLEAWVSHEEDKLRPADPFVDGLPSVLETEIETLSARLHMVDRDETRARELNGQLKLAVERIDGLRSGLEQERRALGAVEEQIRSLRTERDQAALDRQRAEELLSELFGPIVAALAGLEDWRGQLEADPDALRADCARRVEEWRHKAAARDRAQQEREALAPRLAEAAVRKDASKLDLDQCASKVAEQQNTAIGLEGQRAGLLDGHPAEKIEQALECALVEAREGQEQARRDNDDAGRALTETRGTLAAQQRALEEGEQVAADAEAKLEAGLRAQSVTLPELRSALQRDQDWVEQERAILDGLADALRQTQALADERRRRLEEHRDQGRPELPRDLLAQRLAELDEALKTAQDQWAELHGRRTEDDRRRGLAEEIRAELTRQRQRWETREALRELIGSADGAKFRNFAQGLTLDLLVAHANVHLQDLARRYVLQRVPGAEMELQVVDREMGDEVRSIHTLSGGESFLASLALALGLASLASDRVQVESLFIDEGFGALDADSLDLAIASLDALYGLGRQVGVISHVGTLVERIGVKVQVVKQGGGRSRIEVVSG